MLSRLGNNMVRKNLYILYFVLAGIFFPNFTYSQALNKNDGLDQLSKLDHFYVPVQKIRYAQITSEQIKLNNEGGEKIEFKVIPDGGVSLQSIKKAKFLDKELPVGSKLFKISSQNGKELFCETNETQEIKNCYMDTDNDNNFDIECLGLTDIRGISATFFPKELRYGILRIGICNTLKEENKLKYQRILSEEFEPTDIQIFAEKLPFNQIRVSWVVPTQGGKFNQWGGMIQRVIPKNVNDLHFKLGGLVAKIDLKTEVTNNKRYKISVETFDPNIPMIEINPNQLYSPFMPTELLY